ncbi:hypothetical protein DESPIG_01573 [Desulfovibrio piger ATCC 29098]|uniref:Uncharacterized protein n=1 Tax=Desulfovibrio piger ATCC 29098 TaxID=411464 RepID=B6WU14_9BACT|nr:hypothetical protein DESPIG_01573 [Desulfovibrio piger ATCC 29098]
MLASRKPCRDKAVGVSGRCIPGAVLTGKAPCACGAVRLADSSFRDPAASVPHAGRTSGQYRKRPVQRYPARIP